MRPIVLVDSFPSYWKYAERPPESSCLGSTRGFYIDAPASTKNSSHDNSWNPRNLLNILFKLRSFPFIQFLRKKISSHSLQKLVSLIARPGGYSNSGILKLNYFSLFPIFKFHLGRADVSTTAPNLFFAYFLREEAQILRLSTTQLPEIKRSYLIWLCSKVTGNIPATDQTRYLNERVYENKNFLNLYYLSLKSNSSRDEWK